MVYCTQNKKLYQVRPKKRKRPFGYTEDGWFTTDGYFYESDRLSRCVDWARTHLFQTEFTYFVSVNITEDITPDELKSLWPKVTRYLTDKGVVALWVCEVSKRSNRFNFHLLLRSETPNIKSILKAKFKKLGIKTNIKPERYDPGRRRFSVRYMTKARTPKYRDGELVTADRWKAKRVLMNPEDKIRKYGYVGEFFPKGWNKERIWDEIKKHERKISEGLQQPGTEEYAEFLHDLTGGYFTLKRVRRSVGYFGVPKDWVPQIDDDLLVPDEVEIPEPEDHDQQVEKLVVPEPHSEAPQHAPEGHQKPKTTLGWAGHQKRFTGLPEGKNDVRVQEPRPPPS